MRLRGLVMLSVVALLGVSALLVACGGGDEEENDGEEPGATPPAVAGEAEFEVEQDDFYFEPKELQGRAGKPIKVELENEGQVAHTFTIDELSVDEVVQAGEKVTVEFTPSTDGNFAFYCRFHRSRGMEGELAVSGPTGSLAPSGGGTAGGGSNGGYSSGY